MCPSRFVDADSSAARIARDLAELDQARYSATQGSVTRFAFRPEYLETVSFLRRQAEEAGLSTYTDMAGNFVASNVGMDEWAYGIGSHCDSVRQGGRFDGTLGMLVAIECARLNKQRDLGLPLRLISFIEEEGSGFGRMLLGSAVATGKISEHDLKTGIRALDDGKTFWEHRLATQALLPDRRDSAAILDRLLAWIEVHIEQGDILERQGLSLGVVPRISGWVQSRVVIEGQAGHAGGTPMGSRRDAAVLASHLVLELEARARKANCPTVGTVGSIRLQPDQINVIPGRADVSMDVRGVCDECVRGVSRDTIKSAHELANRRGMTVEQRTEVTHPTTVLDAGLVDLLQRACDRLGEACINVDSGAAHDTMLVAEKVPSGMLFVPCKRGISHSPLEEARAMDAALASLTVCEALSTRHRSMQDTQESGGKAVDR